MAAAAATEHGKFRLDFTVNIPLLLGGLTAIVAGSMWVSSIEARLGSVEEAIKRMAATQSEVSDLKAKVAVLELRAETNGGRIDRLEAGR